MQPSKVVLKIRFHLIGHRSKVRHTYDMAYDLTLNCRNCKLSNSEIASVVSEEIVSTHTPTHTQTIPKRIRTSDAINFRQIRTE